ncbi:hypothetical protein V8B97DRAFT_1920274 [Scleroderma yunnanense]
MYLFQCIPVVKNNEVIAEREKDVDVCVITRSKMMVKEGNDLRQGKGYSIQKRDGTEKPGKCTPDRSLSLSSPDKYIPAYTYESKAMNSAVTKQTFSKMFEIIILNIVVDDLLAMYPTACYLAISGSI